MTLKVDKSNWEKYKLGDIIKWYQKDIPNDEQAAFGIKNYVTAKHIDSDAIKIKRTGKIIDGKKGPTITKHYQDGDLLLSTRSVALCKASIAQNEGVTSEKLLVLRPRADSMVMKNLFPFIFHLSDFWNFAQNSAAGSVNKFTSWTKLREYEFLLPPKDQQNKIAELLWAMDNVISSYKIVQLKLDDLYKSISGRVFSKYVEKYSTELPFNFEKTNWIQNKLENFCILITDGSHLSPKTEVNGMPISTVENMRENSIDIDSCRTISRDDFNYLVRRNCKPEINDVLFSKDGTIGKTFVYKQKANIVLLSSIAIIRTKTNLLLPEYCSLIFESPVFFNEIEKRKSGSALRRIVIRDIKQFQIRVPSLEIQREVVSKLMTIKKELAQLKNLIMISSNMQKSLINEIFS